MKRSKTIVAVLLAVMLSFCVMSVFTGCEDEKNPQPPKETYEFVFTGSTVIAEETYNLTVYGNKDAGKTVSVRIKELPVAELGGTWVKVDGKGYKIYFDDTNSTFIYTKYDTAAKEFSFNYTINIGDTLGGSGKVRFTCKNEAFAGEYDGVGLGKVPPTFNGYTTYIGAVFALHEPVKCVLTCFEDGTCTSVSTNEVKFASPLKGTWSYDADADVYTFVFEPEPFTVDTEKGSAYWKFNKEPGEVTLEEAAAHWEPFGDCYWDNTKTTAPFTSNTYETVYDEGDNTYYLLFRHGMSGFSEFADRYMAFTPED